MLLTKSKSPVSSLAHGLYVMKNPLNDKMFEKNFLCNFGYFTSHGFGTLEPKSAII